LNVVVVVDRIKDTRAPFYRPELPQEESAGVHPDMLSLMKQCWEEEPSERPSFGEVARILKTINKGKSALLCFWAIHSFNILYHCSLKTGKLLEHICLCSPTLTQCNILESLFKGVVVLCIKCRVWIYC